MRIDAHQHFWRIAQAADYPWLSADLAVLYRDYQPPDLEPLLARHGIEGTVLVQAAPRMAETHALLQAAATTPFVKGVVGWCALDSADAPQHIASLAVSPLLRGLRSMVQDIEDDDWLLRETLAPSLAAMARAGLVFDALIHPRHLSRLAKVAEQHPDLQVVVDHGAKPSIRTGDLAVWRRDVAHVARRAKTACKLSGLVTECGDDASIERLRPVVDHLLDCFGPARLVWGSDWPVVNLAGGYDHWIELTEQLLAPLPADEREAVLGANAARLYGVEEQSVSQKPAPTRTDLLPP
jgi:L-fuconolactonase